MTSTNRPTARSVILGCALSGLLAFCSAGTAAADPTPPSDPAPAPAPAGVPHLSSPENPPPGTTTEPVGQSGRGLTYLRELWHAMQTQEINMHDALLLFTQRPLDPNATPPPGMSAGPQPRPATPPAPPPGASPALPPAASPDLPPAAETDPGPASTTPGKLVPDRPQRSTATESSPPDTPRPGAPRASAPAAVGDNSTTAPAATQSAEPATGVTRVGE